nr:hypothetical protein Iba_chr15aCG13700 [Ipomoea batatas]
MATAVSSTATRAEGDLQLRIAHHILERTHRKTPSCIQITIAGLSYFLFLNLNIVCSPEFPEPHRENPLLGQNGIDIVIFPGLRTRRNCNASTPCPRNPIIISRVIEIENRVLNAEIGGEKNPSTKRASRVPQQPRVYAINVEGVATQGQQPHPENTGRASINAWSNPESWRWNSCCSCLWTAPEFGISWVVLLDWEKDKEGLCFIRNLSNKWRTPEIKNITANITMKKRTPGLILLPEEDDGVTVGEIDSFWEK